MISSFLDCSIDEQILIENPKRYHDHFFHLLDMSLTLEKRIVCHIRPAKVDIKASYHHSKSGYSVKSKRSIIPLVAIVELVSLNLGCS